MWPHAGYWTESEASRDVVKCSFPAEERCLGGTRSLCGIGYEGRGCGECSSEYYQEGSKCAACKQDSDKNEQYLQASVVSVLFLVVGVGLATIGRRKLDTAASCLVVFQQLLISMKSAEKSIDMSDIQWLQSTLRLLELFSFNYNFLRPGYVFFLFCVNRRQT